MRILLWSQCCKVKSFFNDWIFTQWTWRLLAQWLNFCSLNMDFTRQHHVCCIVSALTPSPHRKILKSGLKCWSDRLPSLLTWSQIECLNGGQMSLASQYLTPNSLYVALRITDVLFLKVKRQPNQEMIRHSWYACPVKEIDFGHLFKEETGQPIKCLQ